MDEINTSDVLPDSRTGELPSEFYVHEQELMMVLQEVEANRFFSSGAVEDNPIKNLSSQERLDGLPELVDFSGQWGLRFPIPPSVELPLEEVMTAAYTRPLQILKNLQSH